MSQKTDSSVVTTFYMAVETIKIVRQIRFWVIASVISALIAIGSILTLRIF